MKSSAIILTCEHAVNLVPEEFAILFIGREDVLKSHRGWDPGALGIAQHLADFLDAPLYHGSISRLLVDLNRSLHHEQLFSEFSEMLSVESKSYLLKIYSKYRNEVTSHIDQQFKTYQRVIHLSIHTFTPVLNGEERKADIGILFDPERGGERKFSERLRGQLGFLLPQFSVRFNYPYLGTDDGFTKALRHKYDDRYLGIELEINQKHVDTTKMKEIRDRVGQGVDRIVGR